jgi:hypothetical protein
MVAFLRELAATQSVAAAARAAGALGGRRFFSRPIGQAA